MQACIQHIFVFDYWVTPTFGCREPKDDTPGCSLLNLSPGVTSIIHACYDKDTGQEQPEDMCAYVDSPRKDEAPCNREPCSQRRSVGPFQLTDSIRSAAQRSLGLSKLTWSYLKQNREPRSRRGSVGLLQLTESIRSATENSVRRQGHSVSPSNCRHTWNRAMITERVSWSCPIDCEYTEGELCSKARSLSLSKLTVIIPKMEQTVMITEVSWSRPVDCEYTPSATENSAQRKSYSVCLN